MKITIETADEVVIYLSGQLDTITSVDFEKEIQQILGGNPTCVILDGTELTYVSSAGLRLLLTLQKGMMARNGRFILRNIRKEIMDIFSITGFTSILTIE